MASTDTRTGAEGAGPAEGPDGQRDRALVERTVLDEQVSGSRRTDRQSWGVLVWLGPIVTLAVLIVAGSLLDLAVAPRHGPGRTVVGIALSAMVEVVLLGALLVFGRPMAARGGGWRPTFGLDRIRARDWAPWAFGLLFVYLGRTVVNVLAAVLTNGRALAEASNLRLAHPGPASVVGIAVVVVLLAPVTEELMFRGLLLRSFMRRMPFWPAALLSTLLFALFHTYEVHTLAGAVTLACSVAALGLGNCYLVRISGRLTPAIMVHASFNALALTLALLLGHG
jgi:membrane protease YdiL (CAAX protease family)